MTFPKHSFLGVSHNQNHHFQQLTVHISLSFQPTHRQRKITNFKQGAEQSLKIAIKNLISNLPV